VTPILTLSASPASSSAPSPSPSTSANSPATFLRSYPSKEGFYTSIREFVKTSHGVTIWRYNDTTDHAVVVCGRRQATDCQWKMRVDRKKAGEEEKWVINEGMSFLEHHHERPKGAASRDRSSAQAAEAQGEHSMPSSIPDLVTRS
jgi:hypothetical protein